jgi:hypothetical protein
MLQTTRSSIQNGNDFGSRMTTAGISGKLDVRTPVAPGINHLFLRPDRSVCVEAEQHGCQQGGDPDGANLCVPCYNDRVEDEILTHRLEASFKD